MVTGAQSRQFRPLIPLGLFAAAIAIAMTGCGPRLDFDVSPQMASQSENATYTALSKAVESGGIPSIRKQYGEPVGDYATLLDTDGRETYLRYALSDGREYLLGWGLDAKGVATVLRHSVTASATVELTARDRAFISAIQDGNTPLKDAQAYVAKHAAGVWRPTVALQPGVRDTSYLWLCADGSGFLISDRRGLKGAQLGPDRVDPNYTVVDWPSSHFWVVSDAP